MSPEKVQMLGLLIMGSMVVIIGWTALVLWMIKRR